MTDPDFTKDHADPGESAGDGANTGEGGALSAIGEPVAGTDARPDDLFPGLAPSLPDPDAQGGDNEAQDALRAHARAQGADEQVRRGSDDLRASGSEGSLNDNGNL